MTLKVGEIGELLRLIETSSFEEVTIELEGTRITARRASSNGDAAGFVPAEAAGARPSAMSATHRSAASATVSSVAQLPPALYTPPLRRPLATASAPSSGVPQGQIGVRAPMVGTFFRRPAPDQPVLVEVGQRVRKGQPLCLIEVMKLYTTVEAPADGVIEAILAEDGALVEYDQALFAIKAG